jgi:hypothetical protein
MTYETRITRLTIAPSDEPIFSEQATHIELDDEAAGEFVVLKQNRDDKGTGRVSFDFNEWEHIVAAVARLKKGART